MLPLLIRRIPGIPLSIILAVVLQLIPFPSKGQYYYLYLITDSRDGKLYKTVHIDDKWWMAENLNYGTRIDGYVSQADNGRAEKYCPYATENSCSTYGGLYQWDELMQYGHVEFNRGLCPSGWHVSSDAEWKNLETFLGMDADELNDVGFRGGDEGGMLKSTGTDHWISPNTKATNTYGFSALPAGYRDTTGIVLQTTKSACFWIADFFEGYPWFRGMTFDSSSIMRSPADRRFGASARCVKDSPYMFGRGSFTDSRDGKSYKRVLIGNHWWMAENLNAGTRIDAGELQHDFGDIQKYCYNNQESYCDTYGGLYQWNEAMFHNPGDKQGICPDGWHMPTDNDWMALEWAAGMAEADLDKTGCQGRLGLFLQDVGYSGFDVLLGGGVDALGNFIELDDFAYMWTSNETNDQVASARIFQKDVQCRGRYANYYKSEGMSVRCVCDKDEIVTLTVEADDTVCTGMETTLRAKTSGGSGTKYFYWWSEPAGFTSPDSIITITPEEGTTYNVRIIDGYVYIRDSARMVIRSAPDFTVSGDTVVCPFEEQHTYSVSGNPSYTYEWGDTDGSLISSNDNSAVVSWGNTSGYKYIDVTATDNETGCSTTKRINVNVLPAPQPEIVLKGQALLICTDSGQVYQWYHDDKAIKNATRQFYYARDKETGTYRVEITWENQCRNTSESLHFDEKSTGGSDDGGMHTVFIHPNPTDGHITVEMINDYTGPVDVFVTNSAGRIVKQYRLDKIDAVYATRIIAGELADGSYVVTIEFGSYREVQRIIIKK